MLKRMVGLGLGLVLLGATTPVWAGQQSAEVVSVDWTNRWFSGSMGATRNSPDTNSYIEVSVQASDAYESAMLIAMDESFNIGFCYTTAPSIISALKAVTSDATIMAQWDEYNHCTYVDIRTTSHEPPKAH